MKIKNLVNIPIEKFPIDILKTYHSYSKIFSNQKRLKILLKIKNCNKIFKFRFIENFTSPLRK